MASTASPQLWVQRWPPSNRLTCSPPNARFLTLRRSGDRRGRPCRIRCDSNDSRQESTGIQLYGQIERLLTETARQSQYGWMGRDWSQIEGAWVLKPENSRPTSVVHFIGGMFVGAAPQLTYRLFLERLADRGVLVIATPYAAGFSTKLPAAQPQFAYPKHELFCIVILRIILFILTRNIIETNKLSLTPQNGSYPIIYSLSQYGMSTSLMP
uniref:Uncharacterized protein n=1 Tax=Kalanchoe fedtschenkoi TaxID=63787 RepID=A0A7N0VE98_KALFE